MLGDRYSADTIKTYLMNQFEQSHVDVLDDGLMLLKQPLWGRIILSKAMSLLLPTQSHDTPQTQPTC